MTRRVELAPAAMARTYIPLRWYFYHCWILLLEREVSCVEEDREDPWWDETLLRSIME